MDNDQIKQTLIDKHGYMVPVAELAVEAIGNLHPDLRPLFDDWIKKGVEGAYTFKGISLSDIKEREGCDYPNALFSLSALIKNPKGIDTYLKVPPEHFKRHCGGFNKSQ